MSDNPYPRPDYSPQPGPAPYGAAPFGGGQYPPPAAPQQPVSPQPGQPAPGQPAPRASDRRGPGWGGVIATAVVCSLLSGVGTYAAVTTLNAQPTTTSPVIEQAPRTELPEVATASDVAWAEVASAVGPSTASIQVQSRQGSSSGSGVVYDSSGHILTNHHVASSLGSGATITVTMPDGLTYPATLVGSDVDTDIAILELDTPPEGLRPATFGDSDELVVGQPVMAIGAPLGLQNTVTTGIVSALHRPVMAQQGAAPSDNPFGPATEAQYSATSAVQTDASINPGNSGGALVDAGGRVIGINSSIASNATSPGSAGSIGLGFAIPANTAKTIADQLIATGEAKHPLVGVSVANARVALGTGLARGAPVAVVPPDAAGSRAGRLAGAVSTSIDGVNVDTSTAVIAYVRSQEIGSTHTFTVIRDGQQIEVEVTLDVGA
ncbi:MAG: trypsin-like peptidase domain-containing protein [Propionibacteriaceae bacterium]|nr:trypsin-like peptidase domain-containing protein [Propionibacteriaceae bacterium]